MQQRARTSPLSPTILIIIVLLCRCGPNMRKYVFPWAIWRVLHLSSNKKLLQMQEYMHVLMQLSTGSPPYIPHDAPMPHACKQVLNMCPKVVGRNQHGYINPTFSGSQWWGEINLERSGCGGNKQKMCKKGWKWVKVGENPKIPYPQCGRSIKISCQTTMKPRVSKSMGF